MRRGGKTAAGLTAIAAVVAALSLAAPRAEAIPDHERDVKAWRFDRETMPFRWSYAVDPDRQPGEQVKRVYIAGKRAERVGSLFIRREVSVDPRIGKAVHVRIVLDGRDWHYWVDTKRIDYSGVQTHG